MRQSCGQWGKHVPKLAELLVPYGLRRRRKSDLELAEAARERAAARAAAANPASNSGTKTNG